MDAFVIKTKRDNTTTGKKDKKRKPMKQVTIEALPVSMMKVVFCFLAHW